MEPSSSEVRRLKQELAAHRRSFRAPAVAVWTPARTGVFLDAITGHRLSALYHLTAFRGLRRGEAVGLTWVHVDRILTALQADAPADQVGVRRQVSGQRPAADA